MEVKTVEAFSMTEAVKKVKKLYGSDAVILSTKEKPVKGHQSPSVELRIAISEELNRAGAAKDGLNSGYKGEKDLLLQEKLESLERRLAYLSEQMPSKDQVSRIEQGMKELKVLCNQHLRHFTTGDDPDLPESIRQTEQQLSLVGVDPIYKKEVIDYLRDLPAFNPLKSDKYRSSDDYHRANAIRFMYKKVSVCPPIKPIHGCNSVNMIVGGHGVGKTCTIAKLASELKVNEKTNVLLVSYDYRSLGLQDPLPVYAKILGIAHATIEEASQLEEVVLANRQCEVVLIDTSGGLVRSDQELKKILAIKDLPLPVDTHLVLSLTESSVQQEQSIQKFSPLGLQSFLFTKLDESWTCGDIYNHVNRWSVPVSYFSTGPRIPGYLESASRERVMERIFAL